MGHIVCGLRHNIPKLISSPNTQNKIKNIVKSKLGPRRDFITLFIHNAVYKASGDKKKFDLL